MTNEFGRDAWLLKFRWIMPLTLLPFAILAAFQADVARNHHIGHSLRDGWEIFCLAVAFGGLAIRFLSVGFAESGPGSPSGGRSAFDRYCTQSSATHSISGPTFHSSAFRCCPA